MNKDLNLEIGKKLFEARKTKRMSRAELGKFVNLHESTIKRYEDGDIKTLGLDKLKQFASILNIDPVYLMGWGTQIVPSASHEYPFIADFFSGDVPVNIQCIHNYPLISVSDLFMRQYSGVSGIIIVNVIKNSMNRCIPPGSYIVINTNVDLNDLKDGDIVVFEHNKKYNMKRFYRHPDDHKLLFKPDSTELYCTDKIYSSKDISIFGKVIITIRNEAL